MALSDLPRPTTKPKKTTANRRSRRAVAAGTIPPNLPPSVEEAYRKKCIELKRRMGEVEQNNDSFRLRKNRLLRGIRKMRLERALLLHELGKRMRKNGTNGYWDEESEGSSEGPPTVCYHLLSILTMARYLLRYAKSGWDISQTISLFDRNVAIAAQRLLLHPWPSSSQSLTQSSISVKTPTSSHPTHLTVSSRSRWSPPLTELLTLLLLSR